MGIAVIVLVLSVILSFVFMNMIEGKIEKLGERISASDAKKCSEIAEWRKNCADTNKLLDYMGITEKAAEEKMLKELGKGWGFHLGPNGYLSGDKLFLLGPSGYSAQGNDKLSLLSEALAQREKAKSFCPEIGKKK